MNCPNCSNSLEIYSLEYKWNHNVMEPRAWYFCGYYHQIWIMNGKELIRNVPLTELTN
jgi:hypothetical protein